MISVGTEPSLDALAARIEARAETLARTRAERVELTRNEASRRWRRASLLWPFFAKG